jgi:mRNA-degrading endonuclease RelE of RelBE toxin-antitoxin system
MNCGNNYSPPCIDRDFSGGGRRSRLRVHYRPSADGSHRIGKRLLPPMDDGFSARRGTYRVIYRIDDKTRIVTVVDVAHRSDVYRT